MPPHSTPSTTPSTPSTPHTDRFPASLDPDSSVSNTHSPDSSNSNDDSIDYSTDYSYDSSSDTEPPNEVVQGDDSPDLPNDYVAVAIVSQGTETSDVNSTVNATVKSHHNAPPPPPGRARLFDPDNIEPGSAEAPQPLSDACAPCMHSLVVTCKSVYQGLLPCICVYVP